MTSATTTSKRVALVTGASRGIGRAIAIALAADGLHVAVNFASNEAAATEVVATITGAGGSAELLAFDVANADAVEAQVKALAARLGRIDVVVANAGIAIDGLLLRQKRDDWQRTLDTNLSGAFYVIKAATRYLLRAEHGRIVTLSSVVGESGNAGQAAYAASKAGLIGFTRSVAKELASRGVTANVVSPGFIDTDMTAAHLQGELKEKLLKEIPLGRVGKPEDIASAVRFLCSVEASYITGQVLRVNGGLHIG